jgi:5'-deoxynucleotidase YfbR-like HD superfamily hydrolase
MYCRYLVASIDPKVSTEDLLLLLETAMWHDMPETKTGDMSTPLKRCIERDYPKGESPLDKLEMKLCPPYAQLKERIKGSYLEVILKLADIMDAIHFIERSGVGKAAGRISRERCVAFQSYVTLGHSKWPEYNWLGASVVLDDLLNGEPDTLDFEEMIKEVKLKE